jgi:hypothetical protein
MMIEEARRIVSKGQLRKRRKDGWSRKDERVFHSHLRVTGNVTASALAAGRKPNRAYDLRKRDPVFAAQWDEALRECKLRLHSKLIAYAHSGGAEPALDEDGEPVDPGMGNFDPELAFKVLRYHPDGERNGRRRSGPPPVSDEELNAALLCQFDALDRRRRRQRIDG